MNITGVSDLSTALASQATTMKASQVEQAIGTAVLKQTMDQNKAAGEAVVRMLQDNPTPLAVGGNVDVNA